MNLTVLGIIGQWLTEEIEYKEKVLEFRELRGRYSGDSLVVAVEERLLELGLEKLFAITDDNAINNKRMALHLHRRLAVHEGNNILGQGS
jgi:hypothetical protein